MNRTVGLAESIIAWLSSRAGSVGVLFLCFAVSVIIIARFVFSAALPGAIEISEYLLLAAIFLSFSYTALVGRHVRVVTVLSRLPPKWQCIINVTTVLLVAVLWFIMTWTIAQATYVAWAEKHLTPLVKYVLPTWPAQFCAFIGCFLILTAYLTQLWRNVQGLLDGWKVVGFKTWDK